MSTFIPRSSAEECVYAVGLVPEDSIFDFRPKAPGEPGIDVAFFNLNGTWLGLYGREALAEDATVASKGSGFPGFTLSHNLASEAEVDQTLAQVVAAGATLVKPPQQVFWGGYSGYFKDPDGYLWEVAYNPHEWIGPEDDESQ